MVINTLQYDARYTQHKNSCFCITFGNLLSAWCWGAGGRTSRWEATPCLLFLYIRSWPVRVEAVLSIPQSEGRSWHCNLWPMEYRLAVNIRLILLQSAIVRSAWTMCGSVRLYKLKMFDSLEIPRLRWSTRVISDFARAQYCTLSQVIK